MAESFKISCCCSLKYKYSHVKVLADEVSSDWPHQKISSTDSKDRSTLIPNQNKRNISCKNAARDNSFHYTIGFRLLTSKEGLAKAMNLQKLFMAFFAVCVSANCLLKRSVSQAISLFEQYIIHVRVTSNVHQIIKRCISFHNI